MRIICTVIFFILGVITSGYASDGYTISGVIVDDNNHPIQGATIISQKEPTRGATTNANGEFSFISSRPQTQVTISFIGYKTTTTEIDAAKNEEAKVTLTEQATNMETVVVSSKSADDRVSNVQIGVEKIVVGDLVKMPNLFGERDIIKSMTLLPGVKAEAEGSSGFQVRGGLASQNLILFDYAPMYNAGHLMGIFSLFNDDVVESVSLYKGQIPAQFGGAASSVLNITSASGDKRDYDFGASIGLLSAELVAGGPIVRDQLSFLVSARRSYYDLFLAASEEYKDNSMNFSDLNAKLDWQANKNNTFAVNLFRGSDVLDIGTLIDTQWNNASSSAVWRHRYNPQLRSTTSLVWSAYDAKYTIDIMDTDDELSAFIKYYGFQHEFIYQPNKRHLLRFGYNTNLHVLESAEWYMSGQYERECRSGWENSVWINDEWTISPRLAVLYGLRLSNFSVMGGSPYYEIDHTSGEITHTYNYPSGEVVKNYTHLEPRLSANFRVNTNYSIKAGYCRSSQNLHALRNSAVTRVFSRYAMTSNIVKPQIADQVSLGVMALTNDKEFEFSLEGYYKNVDNMYDYRDGKSFDSEIELERLILDGKGRSYGVELFAKRNIGRLTGWVGYTLSWSQSKIEGINNGEWYDASNDRRHDISVVGIYPLSDKWSASASWVYNTGQALSAPSAKYEIDGETLYYYAERNGYRAPAYHRLDISLTNTKQHAKYTREWNIGLYNLYNRYNAYMITFEDDETSATGTATTLYTLYGILPSVSFGIKF